MSKNHKDIENAELHVPKDFSTAANSTVLSKDASGNLEWVSKNDVGGSQGPQGPQGDSVNFDNQVIVQKNPQVGQFSSVKSAIDSITDASASNRYEIIIGPGVYDEQPIAMKQYVNVRGVGRESVIINGVNNGAHLITATHNCELSDVTVCFSDDTGTGYALIYHTSQGAANTQAFYATNIRFGASDILCKVESTTSFVQTHLRDFDFGGSITTSTFNYGFQSIYSGGGKPRLIMQNGRPTQQVSGVRCLELFRAQGSGADLVVSNCFANSGGNYDNGDSVGAGTLSQYAFVAQDGANVRVLGGTARGFETCVYAPNTGAAPSINIQGLYTDRNQWDFDILQPSTTGNILVQAKQSKIKNIASSDLSFMLIDIESGEQGVFNLGKFKVAPGGNTDGTFDMAYLAKYATPSGLYSGGVISDAGGVTIDVTAGRGYFYDLTGDIFKEVIWTAKTGYSVTANSDVYITIDENGDISEQASITKTARVIVLGRVVTAASDIRLIENAPAHGKHAVNRVWDFHRNTFGCVYESGSTVAENGTVAHNLDVGSGVRWFMGNEITSAGGSQITFTQLYRDGGSGWTETSLQTVNNTQYDDGDGGLASLTASYYSARYLYIVGSDADSTEKYYLQLGQAEYATQGAAEAESPPTPPSWLKDGAVVIAQIVVQQGASNIVSVTSLKPTLGGAASGGGGAASDHGNLTGLGDDDHSQYLLADGTRSMSGDLNMGTNDISNVGTVDGVDVSAHASRHLPNGADPLITATAVSIGSTNAEGTANSFSRSDHTHEVTLLDLSAGNFTLQQMHNTNHSAGILEPTDFVISDNGDGSIALTAGEAFVRSSNSRTASLYYVSVSATNPVSLTDASDNYIYLDYNAGSPAITVSTTQSTDYNTKVHLGQVYRNGTDLHIAQEERVIVGDHASQMVQRMLSTAPYARNMDGTGGGIVTETGTRNIAVSQWKGWHGLEPLTIAALNTNTGDTFNYWYNRAAWTSTTGATQFSNTQYDNAGTLTNLSSGYYKCDWIYVETDGDLEVIYGNQQHLSLGDARAELAPTSIPAQLSGHAILMAKIISQEGQTNAIEVLSYWQNPLEKTTANDHGALQGLSDDDHTQYLLADGTRAMSGNLDMGGNDITNLGTIPIDNTAAGATADTSTASATYVVMDSMTLTPVAGTYLIIFSASGNIDTNGGNGEYAIHVNGTIVQASERNLNFNGGAGFTSADTGLHTMAIQTVNGSQAIDVRYRTDSGNFTVHERALALVRLA